MIFRFTLPAFAKVNLFLRIGEKQPSGYHLLETVFQEISLKDSLTFFQQKKSLSMTTNHPGLRTDKTNLVRRALHLLNAVLKTNKGIHIHLEKRIPIGAGLGGGSSDAATALIGGYMMWKKPKIRFNLLRKNPPPLLLECARKLGADVPFFLRGGCAFGQGYGDLLTPLYGGARRWLVVVYPHISVSTKEAYQWMDKLKRNRHKLNKGMPKNSFEPVVASKIPVIGEALQTLKKLGCRSVTLSGSGSAVFGFVKNKTQGQDVIDQLQSHSFRSYLVHTL